MKLYSSVSHRHAFTLTELLVVLAVVGILIAMLLPAVQSVRESSRRVACANNSRQVALALQSFEGANSALPPTIGRGLLHWHTFTLPFLGQSNLFTDVIRVSNAGVNPLRNPSRSINVSIFQCVSNPQLGLVIRPDSGTLFSYTDYCGVAGVSSVVSDGVFITDLRLLEEREWKGVSFSEISDGLSNTLQFGERPANPTDEGFGSWLGSQNSLASAIGIFEEATEICGIDEIGYGANSTEHCSWRYHWSFHSGGSNFARADGSIHFLPYATDRSVLSALATRGGQEVTGN